AANSEHAATPHPIPPPQGGRGTPFPGRGSLVRQEDVSASLGVEGVTVDFQGLRAIEKVSLSLAPGEILGLIGPNGAGKTTLVNVLTGFQQPTQGRVRLARADIPLWPAFKRSRAGLARTFQSVLLFKGLSVMENIEAGAVAVGLDREAARKRP